MTYQDFLARKSQLDGDYGFAPAGLPDFLFDFQQSLVDWATRKGRAAIFADCGLGKTPMQLVWADQVARHTGKAVLILTPLAVSQQTTVEADKFGIDAAVSRDGTLPAPIVVTNYERLHYFDASKIGGVVCDESSAIKAFDGQRRADVTAFMRKHPYRLLCTATAAPNDYTELGTSSEALGYLGFIVDDSSRCSVASADYLVCFRKRGDNPVPIAHPLGLSEYAGERQIPAELERFRNWTGKQTENRYSHWIWRQYASAFWDDVRLDRVLPFREARDSEDEKHVHPLQLDVIDRTLTLWSNPGERVLTPFMGVGSEVYGAVRNGRLGVGVEIKPSYYRQAVKNVQQAYAEADSAPLTIFDTVEDGLS